MTPERFWDGDPDDFWVYWDAYEMKKKDEARESNINAFNQGQYFMLAIAQCLQFTKHPKQIYPKQPFALKGDKKVQMTQKEYEEIRKIQAKAMVDRFNARKK